MAEQTWIDPPAVRRSGALFAETARAIDVACAGLGECDFGAHLGRRYAHHDIDYAAGLLAIAQSVTKLAQSAQQFGDGLVAAADTLDTHDRAHAELIADGGGEHG